MFDNSMIPRPPAVDDGSLRAWIGDDRIVDRISWWGGALELPEYGGTFDPLTPNTELTTPPASDTRLVNALRNAAMFMRADEGVNLGTGSDVDSWDTLSTSAFALTTASANKPQQTPGGIEFVSANAEYMTGGDTSTFQKATESGVFMFAGFMKLNAFTGDRYIVHTKGAARGVFIGIQGGVNFRFVLSNAANATLVLIDGSMAGYSPGDDLDFVIIGDGTTVRMYLDGVEVGSAPVATQSGPHAHIVYVGRSANVATGYLDAELYSLVYDDQRAWSADDVTEIRNLMIPA